MLKYIRKIAFKKGYKISRLKTENFRDQNFSPIEALYRAQGNRVLLSIPIEKCRTQLWHTLESTNNPFVRTLIDYNTGKSNGYKDSAMESYYRRFQPQSAAEVLRLPNNRSLKGIEALRFVLPWDTKDSLQAKAIRQSVAQKENKLNGENMGLEYGYTEFGPISLEKGNLEFKRLINIFHSIKSNGYSESLYHKDGGIRGYFLSDGIDYCFILIAGKHRSYALSALGYDEIPVVMDLNVDSIYYPVENAFWLNVRNSIFTENDVSLLFENLLTLPPEMLSNHN